jgi:uroporphyrinogen-III synthase
MPNMQTQSLSGFTIVVTRPADQAKKLNALITELGGKVIDFPLIDIAPLNDYAEFNAKIAHLDQYDWLIFISSNAVQNAMPRIEQLWTNKLPSNLKYAAIGPVTAQTLNKFGVKGVLIPEGRFDSEALLTLPPMQEMQGKNVMIVRGVGGRELLANTLKSRGASITFAECYQRLNPQQDCQPIQTNQCHALVVTSSEAMRHLLSLANNQQKDQNDWLRKLKICVNHQRIAEETEGFELQIYVADAPGDEAMLRCLQCALHSSTG